MPKDNENIPVPLLFPDDPDLTSGPQPFAPDQMVACERCLRTNPPTRVNCIYCGDVLPTNETTFELQKPTLRRLEKWEQGYNNIVVLTSANAAAVSPGSDLAGAADLLKLPETDLVRIVSCGVPLPLARAATLDEASLVERRLRGLGIESRILADAELGLNETGPTRVRAIEIDEVGFRAYQSAESPPIQISWTALDLIVTGRLISTRVELKEQKGSRAEDRIVDSSEFFRDEVVLDFYAGNQSTTYRIAANSFDFSCLGQRKCLVTGENMTTLLAVFRERAPHAEVDESYNSLRKTLEPVWPVEQQNESIGWRRERPGKYTIGSAAEKNNEAQFIRYSLLRRYLHSEARARVE